MPDSAPPLLRQKALDRLSSPDRLDESIQIVAPSDWLPVLVVGGLLVLALVWSITGRVATTVSGRGVLIHPRAVIDLQTLGSGRVTDLRVRTGDRVTRGQVVGAIDQFELRRRLEQDRALLVELEAQDRTKERVQTDESSRQKKQTDLTKDYARSQAEALRKSLVDAQALQPIIDQRLKSVRALRDEGLLATSAPELLKAEQTSLDNARRITDVAAQLKQLDLQIAQSEGLEMSLSRQHLEADSSRRVEIQRLKSSLAINDVQIEKNSQIVAPADGRVLEVLRENGHVVAVGARVATIEVNDPNATIINVAYLEVGVGKQVRPGMAVLVTPDGVARQRYGGITGTVTTVSDLAVTTDGVRAMVGNAELAQGLLAGGGARIEVVATLDTNAANLSGYRWSSSAGPSLPVTAGLTGDIRVVVDRRAPITYVLPFLRELTGVR